MMTVHEVSRLTGLSVRTLQYYDKIGLLRPAERTKAGYRLYDGAALERLQQILLFRELEFPLKQIRAILSRADFDRAAALEQQIALLRMKKEHLENLLAFARGIQKNGGKTMDFSAFDTTKMDEYAAQAKKAWGGTAAYREFEKKSRGRTAEEDRVLADGLMAIFTRFGALKAGAPEAAPAQAQAAALQAYLTAHYYTCTPEILRGLGRMYAAGGEMTDNIDAAGGPGTAVFAARAIEAFCGASAAG